MLLLTGAALPVSAEVQVGDTGYYTRFQGQGKSIGRARHEIADDKIVERVGERHQKSGQDAGQDFGDHHLEKCLTNEVIINSLINTLIIAVISSIIATVIGTLAAIGIVNMKRWQRSLIMNITYMPVINPEIIIG